MIKTILNDLLTDTGHGDPTALIQEINFLLEDKGYPISRVFSLGVKLGIPEDVITTTLFQVYRDELTIFN